jgi:hypothetical protein
MDKRFWISGVVMSLAVMALGFIVHGMLLHDDYLALGTMMRPEAEAHNYFHWMIVANVLMGFALTWIYRQGIDRSKSTISQGLRFGLAIVCLMTIPMFLIYYVVLPFPAALVQKQIAFEVIGMLLLGVLVAWLNPRSRTS